MSNRKHIIGLLREVPDAQLIDDDDLAYPVVSPRTVQAASEILLIARSLEQRVILMGTGSSFASDFKLSTESAIAVFVAQLAGTVANTPFTSTVMAGSRLDVIVLGNPIVERKTLGGLLSDIARPALLDVLDAIWRRVVRLHVLGADGCTHVLTGPRGMTRDDPMSATALLGSQGRSGMITAVELIGPVPFACENSGERATLTGGADYGDAALSRTSVRARLDPGGLFQW